MKDRINLKFCLFIHLLICVFIILNQQLTEQWILQNKDTPQPRSTTLLVARAVSPLPGIASLKRTSKKSQLFSSKTTSSQSMSHSSKTKTSNPSKITSNLSRTRTMSKHRSRFTILQEESQTSLQVDNELSYFFEFSLNFLKSEIRIKWALIELK